MSGSGPDNPKREILNPTDTLQDLSDDPAARAEAQARAARRAIEEQERKRQDDEKKRKEEAERKLGWYGRFARDFRAFAEYVASPFQAFGAFFAEHFPGAAAFISRAFAWIAPLVLAIATTTDAAGTRKLTLVGRIAIAAAALIVVWPFFKIYYVLGTTRDFHNVHITFKQIIDQDRYLVFGDYIDSAGVKENMAFNVTDSWVYWNWTPDLTFAQVPVVGKCDFHTYGWYLRVPRFVPLAGRTLLVEPVVIDAKCAASDIPATTTGAGGG